MERGQAEKSVQYEVGGAVVVVHCCLTERELDSTSGCFCVACACIPGVCVGSLRVLRLPPTVQKHAKLGVRLISPHLRPKMLR